MKKNKRMTTVIVDTVELFLSDVDKQLMKGRRHLSLGKNKEAKINILLNTFQIACQLIRTSTKLSIMLMFIHKSSQVPLICHSPLLGGTIDTHYYHNLVCSVSIRSALFERLRYHKS